MKIDLKRLTSKGGKDKILVSGGDTTRVEIFNSYEFYEEILNKKIFTVRILFFNALLNEFTSVRNIFLYCILNFRLWVKVYQQFSHVVHNLSRATRLVPDLVFVDSWA